VAIAPASPNLKMTLLDRAAVGIVRSGPLANDSVEPRMDTNKPESGPASGRDLDPRWRVTEK
jgi:hypothetical protein